MCIYLLVGDRWSQWNQWGHWNATGPGTGHWEWSEVPPPGVTMGPDGRPMGLPSVPLVPPAPNISGGGNFNVPPPAPPPPYFNSGPAGQQYNQVIGTTFNLNFFFSYSRTVL